MPLSAWGIDMEQRVMWMCVRVMNEVYASLDKHGDWSDYSDDEMTQAITGELLEIDQAMLAKDVDGQHGLQSNRRCGTVWGVRYD
jgi:hypothetical protein